MLEDYCIVNGIFKENDLANSKSDVSIERFRLNTSILVSVHIILHIICEYYLLVRQYTVDRDSIAIKLKRINVNSNTRKL